MTILYYAYLWLYNNIIDPMLLDNELVIATARVIVNVTTVMVLEASITII